MLRQYFHYHTYLLIRTTVFSVAFFRKIFTLTFTEWQYYLPFLSLLIFLNRVWEILILSTNRWTVRNIDEPMSPVPIFNYSSSRATWQMLLRCDHYNFAANAGVFFFVVILVIDIRIINWKSTCWTNYILQR